jgi:hypothetical protein
MGQMSVGVILFMILIPDVERGCINLIEGQAFRKGLAAKSQIGPEYRDCGVSTYSRAAMADRTRKGSQSATER